MLFRRRSREEPEINLIPMIDLLLVVLIFLMLSTTYSHFSQYQVRLPTGSHRENAHTFTSFPLLILSNGSYVVGKEHIPLRYVHHLADRIATQIQEKGASPGRSLVVINADSHAPSQSIVNAMDAIGRIGVAHVGFTVDDVATK